MKVVFMGTPDFAVPALEALAGSGHEVTLVVTQPDRPKGRSGKLVSSPVKACAEQYGIPVFQPERVKRPEAVEVIEAEKPDVIVVAAYGQILSKKILDIPKYGCINIHGSLLPAYRGAAPIQWAVVNGEEKSGITIMQMNEGMDTGDILLQEEVVLEEKETAGSLYDKLSAMGGPLLLKALEMAQKGELHPVPQKEEEATYAAILKKESGRIDWNASAVSIERLIRGMDPWPGAYTSLGGKNFKIYAADAREAEGGENNALPGTVVKTGKNRIDVACGDGILSLEEIQMEGKKRMKVHDFLLGSKMTGGEVFA